MSSFWVMIQSVVMQRRPSGWKRSSHIQDKAREACEGFNEAVFFSFWNVPRHLTVPDDLPGM